MFHIFQKQRHLPQVADLRTRSRRLINRFSFSSLWEVVLFVQEKYLTSIVGLGRCPYLEGCFASVKINPDEPLQNLKDYRNIIEQRTHTNWEDRSSLSFANPVLWRNPLNISVALFENSVTSLYSPLVTRVSVFGVSGYKSVIVTYSLCKINRQRHSAVGTIKDIVCLPDLYYNNTENCFWESLPKTTHMKPAIKIPISPITRNVSDRSTAKGWNKTSQTSSQYFSITNYNNERQNSMKCYTVNCL